MTEVASGMLGTLDPDNRKLDDWYVQINRIYLNKNFESDRFQIFAHLVEVIGGLSTLASDKQKPGTGAERYVPKAIAWWLALCGKAGVRSVEQLLWWKFPGVCPYCNESVHDDAKCQEAKARSRGPDWDELERLGNANASKRPKTIAEWQQMFRTIYPAHASSEPYSMTFARLTEELGELGEALRVQPLAPGYFFSEAADVFAWLMHLQNLHEARIAVPVAQRCKVLTPAFGKSYWGHCSDCRRSVCVCPSILPSTLGRIAHEVPTNRLMSGHDGALLTLADAIELFSSVDVNIGDKTLSVHQSDITELNQAVNQLIKLTLDQGRDLGVHAVLLMDSLYELRSLTDSQEVTDAALSQLVEAIKSIPPSANKDAVVSGINDFSIGVASGAAFEILKAIGTAIAS